MRVQGSGFRVQGLRKSSFPELPQAILGESNLVRPRIAKAIRAMTCHANLKPVTWNLLALFLLTGCILVDDFGKRWNEATPDPCISTLSESLYATEFRRDPEKKDMDTLARPITLNGNYYLLLKKDARDAGGRLYRFTIIHGIFQRWRLNPTMRTAFEVEYAHAPVTLERDTVSIHTLNAETEKLLLEISARPEYWEIEEQTLYNPLRDTACRFDDRPREELEDTAPKRPDKTKKKH